MPTTCGGNFQSKRLPKIGNMDFFNRIGGFASNVFRNQTLDRRRHRDFLTVAIATSSNDREPTSNDCSHCKSFLPEFIRKKIK